MSVAFRNVDVADGAPVEEWPYEAIVTAIERGSLADWLPITRAIRRSPWGIVARQVQDYLGYAQPYGVGPLLARAVARARRDQEREERAEVAAKVGAYIAGSGLRREAFAREIGTSPSRLSTYASGKVVPSAALLLRMARVAGADCQCVDPGPVSDRRATAATG